MDTRQLRQAHPRREGVVEPCDGDIIRRTQSDLGKGFEAAEGAGVIRTENRLGQQLAWVLLEPAGHGLTSLPGGVAGRELQLWIERNAGVDQRASVPATTAFRARQPNRSREVHDPAMA